ncbi:MAG: hypothetical protein WEF86_05815 [Gemmatimonadota bacterium]
MSLPQIFGNIIEPPIGLLGDCWNRRALVRAGGVVFVDVVGATGAGAALAIVVWTGVGLIGDALMVPLLVRVDGTRYLRATAMAVIVAFPAFLIVDGMPAKLVLLGMLGLLGSGWYAILQARLYAALPDSSATVIALGSVFGIAGGLLPLAVGLAANRFGIDVAMWLLVAGPVALLIGARATQPPLNRNGS